MGGQGAAQRRRRRRRRRRRCARYLLVLHQHFSHFFPQKLLGSAKVTRGQHRVYDLRHFRAGAKVAQNRRIVCSWDGSTGIQDLTEGSIISHPAGGGR